MRQAVRLSVLLVVFAVILPASVWAERAKARVLEVNEKKNEVIVDVAGQRRTYHIDDRSLYRVLRRDRLVVIQAELVRGRHTIVNAEAAALEGRVERLDIRNNAVVIRDSESRSSHTYYFDAGVPRDLREGQTITFDVEERGPREVITRWHRR